MEALNPIRTGTRAKYIHQRLLDPKLFDPKSFRVISVSPTRKVVIGCPKGYWDERTQRCLIGTKAQAILRLKPEYAKTRQNSFEVRKIVKDLLKEATLIGKQVTAIEYYDPEKAMREGLPHPERIWRHDFTTTGAKIYGLPDGSILITARKKLWEWR